MTAQPGRPGRASTRSRKSSSSTSRRRSAASGRKPVPGGAHAFASSVAVAVVLDDDVGRGAELLFGPLIREAQLHLTRSHPALREALDEHGPRRDDDPDLVAGVPEIALEQLDSFDDEDRVLGQHRSSFENARDHARMEDALEALELRRVAEDLLGELRAVDLLVLAQHLRAEGLHDPAVADRPEYLSRTGGHVG